MGVHVTVSNNENNIKRKNGRGREKTTDEADVEKENKTAMEQEQSVACKPCPSEHNDHRPPEEASAEEQRREENAHDERRQDSGARGGELVKRSDEHRVGREDKCQHREK